MGARPGSPKIGGMKLAAAAVAVALLLGVSPAHAQPSATPPVQWTPAPAYGVQPSYKRTKRYGMKTAAADALSVGAMFVGALMVATAYDESDYDSDDTEVLGGVLLVGGAIGMFVGAPLVHLSQDNSSSAWKSLGLRVGVPMAIGLVASSTDDADAEDAMASLAGLAFIGVVVLDWAVLSKVEVVETVPVYPYGAPAPGGGYTVGLGGAF